MNSIFYTISFRSLFKMWAASSIKWKWKTDKILWYYIIFFRCQMSNERLKNNWLSIVCIKIQNALNDYLPKSFVGQFLANLHE